MGYTHYFTKKELTHPQDTWDNFVRDTRKVANRFNLVKPKSIDFIKDSLSKVKDSTSQIKIGDGLGEGHPPVFSKDEICFNGVGEEAHETLLIERDNSDILTKTGRWSKYYKETWEKDHTYEGFVKTARKPYDLLVTATLVLYKHHFGDIVEISGDGGEEGFEEGKKLISEVLGI